MDRAIPTTATDDLDTRLNAVGKPYGANYDPDYKVRHKVPPLRRLSKPQTGIRFVGDTKPLEAHPLADMFPLMEGEELTALINDIKVNGQREPITLYEGKILDGRNRYRACIELGRKPETREHHAGCAYIGDPLAYIISANIHRRHLTPGQKRDLIAKLLKADPEKSDRQIAETVKASPTFVGKVRAEKEATGDVSTVDTRTDTKGRKQPAKKQRKRDRKTDAPITSDTVEANVERDRKACIALNQRVTDAERELEQHIETITARLRERVHELERENLALRAENEDLKAQLAKQAASAAATGDALLKATKAVVARDVKLGLIDEADLLLTISRQKKDGTPRPDAPDDGLDIPKCLRRTPAGGA
jgi:hypothetical protein